MNTNTVETSPFGTGSSVTLNPNHYLWIGLAIVVTGIVYTLGLNGPLLLDDYPNLYGLMQSGASGTPFPELLNRFGLSDNGPLGRPVSMLSFAINAAASGNDLFYWKLVNVLIHCLNGFLLYLLLVSLFLRIPKWDKKAHSLAFFICAIWLANPAQLSSVLYTVQRMNLLAAFFTLSCLLCYVRGKEHFFVSEKVPRYAAAAGCFLLAILSKENAVLCLAFIAIIEVYFFDGLKRLYALLTPQQIKSVRYAAILVVLSFLSLFYFSFADNYAHQPFSIGERILTEPRVLFLYIYQWMVPVPSNLPFFYDDFPKSVSLFSPFSTLLGLAFVAAMIWTAYRLRQRHRLISVAIVWFLIGHSLEASFAPLSLMSEHRNYLPSVGISMAIVYLFMILDVKSIVRDIGMIAYALCLVFLLAVRADLWNNAGELYTASLRYRPHSENLLAADANLLISEKKYNEARQLLRTKPSATTMLHVAYIDCISRGSVDAETLRDITHITHKPISNYWSSTVTDLIQYALSNGCSLPQQEMDALLAKGEESYGLPSQHYWILYYRAQWARKSLQLEKAYALLDELTQTHANPTPYFLRAEWLLDDQQAAEAIQSLADGKKRAGDNMPLYREQIDYLERRLSLG